jgi:hypothetical protein
MTAKASHKMNVTAALVCDDVRKEINGKDILIGVYSGGILVPQFPGEVTMALYLQYEPTVTGKIDGSIRLTNGGDTTFYQGNFNVSIARVELSSMAFPSVVMPVFAPTNYVFEIKESGETEWRVVKRIFATRQSDYDQQKPVA